MSVEKIIWSEKPSKRFILYYSFLYLNTSRHGRGLDPLDLTLVIIIWIIGFFTLLFNPDIRESQGWSGLTGLGIMLLPFIIFLVVRNILLRKSYQYTITDKGVRVTSGFFHQYPKKFHLENLLWKN